MKNPPLDLDQQQGSAAQRRHGRRDGVSFEDVKRAVEKLTQEGLPVSLRSVRAELGTGSLSTLQRHLHALRMLSSPQADAQSPLSAQVLRALATEFHRVTTERTAKISADLKDAQASIEMLVDENEALHLSSAETTELLERTRASLAENTGTADTLRTQLADMSGQLAAAKLDAEAARQALAILQEQKNASEHRRNQAEADLHALRQELVELRRTLSAGKEQHQKQLAETKLRLASLETERSSLTERVTELRTALARSEEHAQQLLEKLLSSAAYSVEAGSAKQ